MLWSSPQHWPRASYSLLRTSCFVMSGTGLSAVPQRGRFAEHMHRVMASLTSDAIASRPASDRPRMKLAASGARFQACGEGKQSEPARGYAILVADKLRAELVQQMLSMRPPVRALRANLIYLRLNHRKPSIFHLMVSLVCSRVQAAHEQGDREFTKNGAVALRGGMEPPRAHIFSPLIVVLLAVSDEVPHLVHGLQERSSRAWPTPSWSRRGGCTSTIDSLYQPARMLIDCCGESADAALQRESKMAHRPHSHDSSVHQDEGMSLRLSLEHRPHGPDSCLQRDDDEWRTRHEQVRDAAHAGHLHGEDVVAGFARDVHRGVKSLRAAAVFQTFTTIQRRGADASSCRARGRDGWGSALQIE